MTEVEKLRAALAWAIENGAWHYEGQFWDMGYADDARKLKVPKEFEDVVRAAVGKSEGRDG